MIESCLSIFGIGKNENRMRMKLEWKTPRELVKCRNSFVRDYQLPRGTDPILSIDI